MNGRLVPLTYQFANGDVVEIIVRANQKPSLDWLKIVASNHARGKIKAYFRKANREENIQRGRAGAGRGMPPPGHADGANCSNRKSCWRSPISRIWPPSMICTR